MATRFLRLTFATCVVFIAFGLSGCGTLIRHYVDTKYPPLSPERRQLAVIQNATDTLPKLHPNAFAYLSGDDLNSYVQLVLGSPIPLDDNAKQWLVKSPSFKGPAVVLGEDEIAFKTQFEVELTGTHSNIDISGIKIAGQIDVRLYPEVITASDAKTATAVRLRPTVDSIEIYELDLSASSHTTLYWFEQRKILSSAINTALHAFRDNINGQLHKDLPVPLAPILVGRKPEDNGKDGVTLTPATLTAIQPQISAGVVRISSKGLTLVTELTTVVVDPDHLPPSQVPPPLPDEMAPPQASKQEINDAFRKLDAAIDQLLASNFTNMPSGSNEVAMKTAALADSFDSALGDKNFRIDYQGAFPEQRPTSDDQKTLRFPDHIDLQCDQLVKLSCDPRGTCAPFFVNAATDELNRQKDICKKATDALGGIANKINSACQRGCVNTPLGKVCLGDIVAPGLCSQAKVEQATQQTILDGCNAAIGTMQAFLNAPQTISKEFANRLGLGDFYTNTCKKYETVFVGPECKATKAAWDAGCGTVQAGINGLVAHKKIGDIDWQVDGDGNDAIKATATVQGVKVSEDLDHTEIKGISANGTARIDGWVKVSFEPVFYSICPPPPCAVVGGDCRITMKPTTLNVANNGQSITGQFGMDMFTDLATGKERKAFYIEPDSFDVDVTSGLAPVAQIIRDNAFSLPCTFNGMTWNVYSLGELAGLLNIPVTVTKAIDPKKTRIAWADSEVKLPTSWKREGNNTVVDTTIPLKVQYALDGSLVLASAEHINPPILPPPDKLLQRAFLELDAGLAGDLGFASNSNRFASSSDIAGGVDAYASLYYHNQIGGGFVSLSSLPDKSNWGIGFGASIHPIRKINRTTILLGARSGENSLTPKLLVGVGWDFSKLVLRGYENTGTN